MRLRITLDQVDAKVDRLTKMVYKLAERQIIMLEELRAEVERNRSVDESAKALKAELAKYQRPDGIMMDSSSWKVTAKNLG